MIALRELGTTGLKVTELGFGTAPLGNLFQPLPDETARATLAAAEKRRASAITTPRLSMASACRSGGWAMRLRLRNDIVLSTKVGRLLKPVPGPVDQTIVRHGYATPMPFEPVYDYSYDAVMRSYEASLQRLGLSKIDILYIHDIGRLTHGEQNAARMAELTKGGGLKALEELRAAKAISGFGMGVNEVPACLEVMSHARLDVILLAGRYTLLEQNPLDDLFPLCEKAGTAIVVGGPYNSGILAVGTKTGAPLYYNYEPAPADVIEKVRRIEAVCDRHGVPLAAAALQFPLAHKLVASVIPGLDSPERVNQTIALYRHKIPAALWQDLVQEKLVRADAPVPN